MPHNLSEYGFIPRDISWPRNISSWRYQLATKIIKFDTDFSVKDHVYADKPSNFEHLKTSIRQVMIEIPPNMCEKVVENYLKRINASRMGHLNDVVFHT